jgi:uncharacterized coiled-coil DUF342 family protein
MTTMKESSKREWTSRDITEDINVGSLQRIADACEKMALRHTELIDARDKYANWLRNCEAERDALRKQVSALRGVITKLRRRAAG